MRILKTRYRRMKWHKWFAWRPTIVGEYIVWLETIEFRYYSDFGWNRYNVRFVGEKDYYTWVI